MRKFLFLKSYFLLKDLLFARKIWDPKQKDFLNFCERFLMASTNRARPSFPTCQMALFNPCTKFKFLGGQMPSFEVL